MASVKGPCVLAQKGSIICRRYFSRTALPLLKLSQGEGTTTGRNFDQFILPAAVVLSVFGFGVSLFSTRQLYDNASRSTFKK